MKEEQERARSAQERGDERRESMFADEREQRESDFEMPIAAEESTNTLNTKGGDTPSTNENSFGGSGGFDLEDGTLTDTRTGTKLDATISSPLSRGSRSISKAFSMGKCLRRTCLHPNLSLRRQLFISFGSVSILSVVFVMVAAIVIVTQTGDRAKQLARANFQEWSEEKVEIWSHVIAETTTKAMGHLEGCTAIVAETTRDRFVGFPNHAGYAEDLLVPFQDTFQDTLAGTKRNAYPLKADADAKLPLDHTPQPTIITGSNQAEYFGPTRRDWYNHPVNMESPTFHIYNGCVPVADVFGEESSICSRESITAPTDTLKLLYEKASDYAPAILRPLYEAHTTVKSIGIHFASSSARASVFYPGHQTNASHFYTSIGCDWMQTTNPYDSSKTILGDNNDDMMPSCHAAGTQVSYADFNPLETAWCRDQALDPFRSSSHGPFREPGGSTGNQWMMGFGQAVYDRVTNEFIACTSAHVPVEEVASVIDDFRVTETSELTLVRWDELGTVVKSDKWDSFRSAQVVTIADLDNGVDHAHFVSMKHAFEEAFVEGYDEHDFHPVDHPNGKVVAAHPIPVPPEEYDASYAPQFMLILTMDDSEIFREVDRMDDAVDDHVMSVIVSTSIAGSMGIGIILLCILFVSMYLTKPLEWMNKVGDQIVDSIGGGAPDISKPESSTSSARRCCSWSPTTEISLLVREFERMVNLFSGKGTAKLHMQKGLEVKNPFNLQVNFQHLYEKSTKSKFKYRGALAHLDRSITFDAGLSSGPGAYPTEDRVHWGPNHRSGAIDTMTYTSRYQSDMQVAEGKRRIITSRLFWWIFGSITLPLLIVMMAISTYVILSINQDLSVLVDDVGQVFLALEERSLLPLATVRAAFAEVVVAASFRDLHLHSRLAGWLLFGGLTKANSFTALTTGVEECKLFPRGQAACPYYQRQEETACDCNWPTANRRSSAQCHNYDSDPRFLQKTWWVGTRLSAWPNGDVNFTTFPDVATSPNTTAWWDDPLTTPGHEQGFDSAAGYDETFDILHSISAMSVVQIPLLNYQTTSTGFTTLASLTAFDKKGILSAYTGCDHSHATFSHFPSNEATGAFKFNPELCPKGKYGYDPRCRNWYVNGKATHIEQDQAPVYLTPPYVFAGTGQIHQLATKPLIDPRTGFYVGQAVVDFDGETIINSLSHERTPLSGDGFHVLVSSTRDSFNTDTVVAPGFQTADLKKNKSAPIEKFVLPNDQCENLETGVGIECENLRNFLAILTDMRQGNSSTTTFVRTDDSGEQETIVWVYAPVNVRSYKALDHSTFNRGVEEHESNFFSVSLALSQKSLRASFEEIEAELNSTVTLAGSILAAFIALAFIAVAYVSSQVTVSIIQPIGQLLTLVTLINKQNNHGTLDDLPEVHGGSLEMTKVYNTFERLHMVVKLANSAYYSGDLKMAYATLQNARDVFTRLGNDKAIGVANNNLGNTMLTMYRTLKQTGAPTICGLRKDEIIKKGIEYFKLSITAGESALTKINKEEGWSTNYLIFMQQLSNRYFNRAMFLLTVKEDHPDPGNAVWQGALDLSTTKDMDREVVDNGDQIGFKGEDDVYFELLLTRIRGVLNLIEMGYDDDWGIDELFEDARQELNKALAQPCHQLFREMEPAGQMQRLDATLIRYYGKIGDKESAATVAVRMMVEDDYVMGEEAVVAMKALTDYLPGVPSEELGGEDPSDIQCKLFQYRRVVHEALSLTKSASAVDLGGATSSRHLTTTANDSTMPTPLYNKSSTHDSGSRVAPRPSKNYNGARRNSQKLVQRESVRQSNTGDLLMEHF